MTIERLKQLGHDLIEEHMTLLENTESISRRERTYKILQERMKGKNPHFGQMKDKGEVMLAIGTLKKMIQNKKIWKPQEQHQ